MSVAGTPSTDPWVIVAREKARYEEQFKSLKPNNGIITGDQAKGFLLQSQLPPPILGQIWALADTDSDGKMNINEFSIACKLINLKLRGFEIPKGLPPSLLASLNVNSSSAIPPVLNASLATIPTRPEPPKVGPLMSSESMVQIQSHSVQPLLPQGISQQPLVPDLSCELSSQENISNLMNMTSVDGLTTGMVPPISSMLPSSVSVSGQALTGIPTGIVPPIPTNNQTMPPLSVGLSGMSNTHVMPITQHTQASNFGTPLVSSVSVVSSPPGPLISTAPLLQGMPPTAPQTGTSASFGIRAPISTPLAGVTSSMPTNMSPVGIQSSVFSANNLDMQCSGTSVSSLDRSHSIESQTDWAVPHQTKLKYTQIFNTTDRTRSGYLSGAQARNVMVQTKLPQNILAQIWALSDMDSDGRLGCEEFVLAMHLCEQAATGNPIPAKLPSDLIPPSFRRTARTASVSSQGSAGLEHDPASTLLQNSFEDKRKENFEKGQAELERRRKTLLDQQRQEREERERKEREEQEKQEKARQEAERKRMEELESQMREQQEKEKLLEEERKRQADQREAARKEMERQRQLEWEKQRLQEIQQQRQREQENVLKLKAKNQSLTIELTSLNDQVMELSQKICDTRVGVSNVKITIDGMRSTRDSQMQEMSQLKNKLKEQNAKLLSLSQEKAKLDAKNKLNSQLSSQDSEQARQTFENKDITINNLKKKIEDLQSEIEGKLSDIENNNSQLTDLQNQLKCLVTECEQLYSVYEPKKNTVLEMKNSNRNTEFDAWKSNDGWKNNTLSDITGWPVDRQTVSVPNESDSVVAIPGIVKYRALYEFVARNNDEISFQPGDIINVPSEQTGEPGWLAGEIRGHTGWFPESYVEPIGGVGVRDTEMNQTPLTFSDDNEATRLEGIAEVPEVTETTNTTAFSTVLTAPTTAISETDDELEYYISNYPYQSQEQGDLTFNAGEVIGVIKKEGDWWTGKIGNNTGIFPSNYVQKVDLSASVINTTAPTTTDATGVSAEAVQTALERVNSQVDNEVSQINQIKPKEVPFDANIQAGAQVVRSKKPEIASVIAPYQSTSSEQLSLARGQLIMIRKKTDSGWWEGELQAKGRKRQVGWFPASYVKVLNSSGKISGRSTPVSTTRMQQEVVIDKVVALYPYTAGNPDELSFEKDDIISVTAREEEAWWRGELNGVCGLFPSNYVSALQPQCKPIQAKKRQESINEFIQTEKTYIQDMSTVLEVFELPLRKSKIIPSEEVDEIFVNWQDILQCNKNFMVDLQAIYKSGGDLIGNVICQHLPRMTAYITFCGKQLDSATLLQKVTENSTAFRELVKKCQNNVATKGMPLSSFLIKPMQRITKYPLLISKIMENTPNDHPDHKYLEEALRIAENFLCSVNENIRRKEREQRMDWLQQYVQNDLHLIFNSDTNMLGPRQILHYGVLMKIKNNKELLGFLFNDFLLLVQPSKNSTFHFSFQRNNSISYKVYKQPILIQYLSVNRDSTDNIEKGTDSNRVLNIQDDKRSTHKISLLASTVNECSLWMKKIDNAKQIYEKIRFLNNKSKIKTKPQMEPICGRLLVLVEMGKLFVYSGNSHGDNVFCKVTLDDQEQQTDIAKDCVSNGNAPQIDVPENPMLVWNQSMQFSLRNISQEVLTFVIFEKKSFSPDEFLGTAELKLIDILRECQNQNGPIKKHLILHHVESGELVVKLDPQLFDK